MCLLKGFVEELYKYVSGSENINDSNIIRIHTRKLEQLGDISFPSDAKSWSSHISSKHICKDSVVDPLPNVLQNMIDISSNWPLTISKAVVDDKNNVLLYLDRQNIYSKIFSLVLKSNNQYGSQNIGCNRNIYVRSFSETANINDFDLSNLKIYLLQKVIIRLLNFTNYNVVDSETLDPSTVLEFVLNNAKSNSSKVVYILCGPVLNTQGSKDILTTANQFFERTTDMRLMAEHKYGVRVTSSLGWCEFFKKLGEAAVIIQLLQNKPQHSMKIDTQGPPCTNTKGPSFVLYNCARLSMLFKEFDKKIEDGIYPQLPSLEELKFDLLTEPEEWELTFVYILQFPLVVRDCIKGVANGRVNVHYLISFLSRLSSVFSVYYRKVRILMEPREHLFPVIHQRIYLLKALEQVMHNCLYLLHIDPVKQM